MAWMENPRSFFLKYMDYRSGIRLTIWDDGLIRQVEFNVNRKPEDEVLKGEGELLDRLRQLYPYPRQSYGLRPWGERIFLGFCNELSRLAERYTRKYPARKRRIKSQEKVMLPSSN